MLTELTTDKYRSWMGIGSFVFWAVGISILPLIGYLIPAWRMFLLATAITAIPVLFFWCCPRARERLSQYVNSWEKAVLNVPGDGHCIIYSLFVVLTEQHIGVQIDSTSQLLNIIEVEIMNNLDFYGPFLGNIDMVKQWRLYKEKGLYDQDIVDLCLHAVANCTGITVDVIQATDHGIRNVVVEPNKPGISSHRTIHLTNSHDHYNPVVSAQTKKNYECNPTLRQQLVIEHPKNEKKHDEKEDRYDYINPNLYIDSSSPLSLNNRYAALGDSSDDCFIVEPHNKKCPHLSGNFAAKSSTFDEQFDLKDEQINAIDQKSDASDKQSDASDKRSTSNDDESHSSDEESHSSDEESHSSDQESHSSDELSDPLRVIGNRTYLNESVWEGWNTRMLKSCR
ncbi:Hypothetical predicted protein [Paramuricea clavata]|uniref:Uncharacterized protein n=1 Tax=Paramuricea clavata TaxID=317549 RepID=A0A7D9IR03_PARCT|nr:Hypothetical predicted protein [Paramuricea clavata]